VDIAGVWVSAVLPLSGHHALYTPPVNSQNLKETLSSPWKKCKGQKVCRVPFRRRSYLILGDAAMKIRFTAYAQPTPYWDTATTQVLEPG
jgi:hypothetical protein